MVARFDPANKTVTVLSIPRDLWVDIPGNDTGISGMNRINAAYDSGPDLLIQTIEQDLGIQINHYIVRRLPGLLGHGQRAGRHHHGLPDRGQGRLHRASTSRRRAARWSTAPPRSQLVRSRHLYYMNSNGYWEYDGAVGLQPHPAPGRVLPGRAGRRSNTSITNPLAINSFIGAAVGNLTIDDTLSRERPAQHRRGLPGSALVAPRHRDAADDRLRHRRRARTCSRRPSPTRRT